MATFTQFALAVSLCLSLAAPDSHGARILSVAFMSTKSHKITYEPLLFELAARGHDVTIVSPFLSGKNRTNVREIKTIEINEEKLGNLFDKKLRGEAIANPFKMLELVYDNCALSYDLPSVRQLLDEKFDLVFVSAAMNECASGFVYKLNTSIIQISPLSAPAHVATVFGSPSPTSFVPNIFTTFGDRMSFLERTANFLVDSAFSLFMFYYFQPTMAELYRAKLHDPNIPLHNEIMRNASLILSNSHLSLSKPRPFLPDIVEVGGMHLHPANPLPKDLAPFLDGSGEHGFILFSMGSIVKASTMPDDFRLKFLRAFGRLKQRVIWKWETEKMDGLPSNVKLSKWLPQQDVLGHPKCKTFITHGGFGGTSEAAYHGVPLIGIPMAGDQSTNLRKSEAAGWATVLDFATLSEDIIFDTINRVLSNSSYRENAQRLSKIFRDQPDEPLDRAVFWTEYVLRHKGAPHLRSAARDLNFFAYHSIDVIAALALATTLLLYIIYAVLLLIVRATCCRASKGKTAAQLKKLN